MTRSQKAPWLKGDNFSPVTDTVLLFLNCNAKLASAGKPGKLPGQPEGQAEKASEDEQAAKEQEAAQQAAAQQNEATQLLSPAATDASACRRALLRQGSRAMDATFAAELADLDAIGQPPWRCR